MNPLTGHLDRVLHGINAEEVLYACDENAASTTPGETGLANPAVHFLRGLRHRNMSAIRHATQVYILYKFSLTVDFCIDPACLLCLAILDVLETDHMALITF